MPSAVELRGTFSQDTGWWDTWHVKTFGSNEPSETLSQFLERAYQRGTVVELGFLMSALGRQDPDKAMRYLPLVDRLILANDRYAGTLDGLLLAVFHAKVYLDVGQPHRGFLCNRRGISLAQSMNLHRNYAKSTKRSIVWWTLYLGDRFLSLLLGLPYTISDNHFTITLTHDPTQVGHASRAFVIHLAVAMGRVIDQVQRHDGPKLSEVLDIEDQLESLATSKPRSWWSHSIPSVADSSVLNDLRERLICHTQYFLTKVYLHLPYLLKTAASHLYKSSNAIALDSARELVSRYHALRSDIHGTPVFDCQTVDFIGFMGAVVMLVGTRRGPGLPSPRDVDLVDKTIRILLQLGAIRTNHLALQCGSTLGTLLALCLPSRRQESPIPPEIRIPYFGVLRVCSQRESESSNFAAAEQQLPSPNVLSRAEDATIGASHDEDLRDCQEGGMPTIAYQGLYSSDYAMDWTQDELYAMPDSLDFMANLDEDWESFLNSGLQ
ncbi:hypothetical protein PV04_07157 [Phialophora macrospora]|uniref:Xylanolytic transcriptional activator regulatory domain-containing protein n=1 Tax=Phialophora macrospora TaxID=1851006 RepID=A0A0D2CI08_9EURO|nr:hypothetical protein PV04_07157 [Phialophora macrospora]